MKLINLPSVEERVKGLLDLGTRVILDRQAADSRGIAKEEVIEGTQLLDINEIQNIILDVWELIIGF